jgi:HSP20 family protein|uniref:Hsp20/alpha crystallin family protein n=1 Tax=Desulfobacca acetoxidans TaxID=60893 RepID=A0A7V6A2S5_9BACT
MADIVQWQPLREVARLRREMDRVFADFFGPQRWGIFPWESEWTPAMDVAETEDQVVVKAEIPGIDPKEITVSLSGDVLTIKGEKKSEREEKKENYHLVERSSGSFSRSITLPAAVNLEKIEAYYQKGVLTITCPKKEKVSPKKIEITAQES